MKMKTKCYIYTRVSTAIQVDGYSLDAQKDKLRKFAEYQEMEIVGEYSDEGFSGKNIKGRHEFTRMLNDIESGKDDVSFVLVFKLSRFGRNAADILNSLQLMQDYGVNLVCVEDGIDSSKESGKLLISILAAVAEMERENIRVQTMAGREQKAREGKWNGGFAPYGYKLVDGELQIAEEEADIIRLIFDRYINTNEGIAGVAKYLNNHGYEKILRQNGTIPGFSSAFIKKVLDNPVYMGKIAYGRRKTEKKTGTRNETHIVTQSEFPIYDGIHEAIISEELWKLAQEKRSKNAFTREKYIDPEHAHILSGLIVCPDCGKKLYGNIAKAHSKDNKTRYYYYCKNTTGHTGHKCNFRVNIEQSKIDSVVANIIKAMTKEGLFKDAIQKKIGSAVDTTDLQTEYNTLSNKLRQAQGVKTRLEDELDSLDIDDSHYDRKVKDLQRRLDIQYDKIDEIEDELTSIHTQIAELKKNAITSESVYTILLHFNDIYSMSSDTEKKQLMRAFIDSIELYPECDKDKNWVKTINFNFKVPIVKNNDTIEDVGSVSLGNDIPLENLITAETVALLTKLNVDEHIYIDLEMSELDITSAEKKASYEQIKSYVLEHTGLKVSHLNIAQIKRKHGIIERDCYNLPKSENSRQPNCTVEKEKAIVDALKYFKMI